MLIGSPPPRNYIAVILLISFLCVPSSAAERLEWRRAI